MVDLSQIQTNVVNFANVGGAAIALVTPGENIGMEPQFMGSSVLGTTPPALMFHIEDENTTTLTSDITDHYTEDNTSLQDQIALKPEIITVTGFIGELNNVVPPGLKFIKSAADRLTLLAPYQPELATAALIAYNQAFQLYQVAQIALAASTAVINSLVGGDTQNKQQNMFTRFWGYWNERRLFRVQTPWAIHTDMAIQSVRAVQDADTRVISSFEVTFKKMRFATIAVEFQGIGRFADAKRNEVNLGSIQGTPVERVL